MSTYSHPTLVLGALDHVGMPLPRLVDLGGEPLVLRRMTPDDAERVHRFYLGLPTVDLLFLRRDVTVGRELNNWLAEIESGETVTIIADDEGTVLGEATLLRTGVPWSRHVGIVRVFTALAQRGRGLGRELLEAICAVAPAEGFEKLVGEMTREQEAAHGLFMRLGFQEEARLRNHIKDRYGAPHDLLILARELVGLDRPARLREAQSAVWRCTDCGFVARMSEPPRTCADCGADGAFLVLLGQE